MNAIVCTKYGSPDFLVAREVEKPAPKKDEVCIKIFATAVTSSDCIVRSFQIPAWKPMGFMMGLVLGFSRPRQPILGIVFAGEVDSIGIQVKSFSAGDQVFGWNLAPAFGAYAEYKCMPENGMLAIKPANLTYDEAAAVPFGGLLALHFLRKGNIQAGQKVLIYGASGAVGTSALQLARYFGAEVTAVCSAANFELVKSLGADHVIDYTKEDFTKSGKRYDLIFNTVGKRKAQMDCRKALSATGKHITVDDGTPKPSSTDLIFLKELAETGKLRPVIDRRYALAQISEAHRYVDAGHKKGNVVISVEHDDLCVENSKSCRQ